MRGFIPNLIVFFIIATTQSGCATVTHGSSQVVTVSSNPSGATVTADGTGSSKTPTTLKLARKNDHVLVFNMDGYQQEQVTILHVVSGAVAGNILLGGLIGWGVDAMTGAQYKLVPETVHVELKAQGTTPASDVDAKLLQMTPDEKLRRLEELYKEKLITEDEYKAMRIVILKELEGNQTSAPPAAAETAPTATTTAVQPTPSTSTSEANDASPPTNQTETKPKRRSAPKGPRTGPSR